MVTPGSSEIEPEIPSEDEMMKLLFTQRGSRQMQEMLPRLSINSLNLIVEKIKDRVWELMMDPYANYFC